MNFYETVMGHRFFEGSVPRIANALERIATALEKQENACANVPSPSAPNGELFALMTAHPELPVIPMVTSGIVADDTYARWIASFGSARVDEYIVGSEHVFFRSEKDRDEADELVADIKGDEAWQKMTYEEVDAAYEAAPWKKAIIVNIDEPDE